MQQEEKYVKGAWLFLSGRVKRTVKGYSVNYYKCGENSPTIGIDNVSNKNRTGCDCVFESLVGAKRELCCSHLIGAVLYNSLKPLLDKKQIKIMVLRKDNQYEELQLSDERLNM